MSVVAPGLGSLRRSPALALAPWSCAVVLALAACGGPASHAAAPAPAPDATTAVAEARGLAKEIELGLQHGDATGLAPLCANDLVALGPRAGDDGRPRGDTLIALQDALPGNRHKLKVKDQLIGSAPGARSAWLSEQLDVDGRRHAVSAVAAEVDGLWIVTAVSVGASASERDLREAGGALPTLAARPPAAGPGAGNLPAPVEPLAAFARAAGDVDARLAQLDGERTVILGAGDRAWHGEKAIRKAWKKGGPRWTVDGDPRAAATPDGALVWIVANAETVEASGPGHPRRLFAIYRRADHDPPPPPAPAPPARKHRPPAATAPAMPAAPPPSWRLVVLQESLAR